MKSFNIPSQSIQHEVVIKKSRFITLIHHAATPVLAHELIQQTRQTYPDARHVCWAFIAGHPQVTTQISCSDDGEPAGTAGKPMLNVLRHSGLGEVVAIVVRYFGGIKLGTGGLVRAYGGAVNAALDETPYHLKIPLQACYLSVPYPLEDAVRQLLQRHSATIEHTHYAELLT
ncbi:MAG TPA: YigZ family protein, partial [Thiothrix sp.]|nr:YigZ family protein [Thiothrix sp.]